MNNKITVKLCDSQEATESSFSSEPQHCSMHIYYMVFWVKCFYSFESQSREQQMFLERKQPLGLERQGFCTSLPGNHSQLKTRIPKRSVLKLLWQPLWVWLWPFLDVIVAVWPRRMRGETVVQNRKTVAQSASSSWHGSGKMVAGYRGKQSSQHFRVLN